MLKKNIIYCGDNLDILKGMDDNSVDLCYIDPPFFTSKQYEVIWGDNAEVRAFEDRWVSMGEGRYTKDINVYLNFMEPRLREIHRVLKPTGSFYLHCDWHADAYLRVLCDQIFGYGNLVNHIVWKRTSHPKGTLSASKKFGIATDSIFWYSKSTEYTFNLSDVRMPLTEEELNQKYNKVDERGRYYNGPIVLSTGMAGPSKGLIYTYKGHTPKIGWRMVVDKLKKTDDCGDLGWTKNNTPFKKLRIENDEGKPMYNFWDDIERTGGNERLGYPTQKPEALLERIIKASSNEGDVVLDAFAGCGTTLAVAKKLNRHFVGVDISPTACRLVAKRVSYPIGEIIGLPIDAGEVAALTGYEFQNAVINLLDPSGKTIKVNNKGADGGIDGTYNGLLISVKKYKAGRKDLDEFVATIYRNKKTDGMFIALEYSSDFSKEVARLSREQEITIKHFTLAQLVKGEHEKAMPKEGFDALRPKETLDDLR